METKFLATTSMEYLHENPSHRDHNQDHGQEMNSNIAKSTEVQKDGAVLMQRMFHTSTITASESY